MKMNLIKINWILVILVLAVKGISAEISTALEKDFESARKADSDGQTKDALAAYEDLQTKARSQWIRAWSNSLKLKMRTSGDQREIIDFEKEFNKFEKMNGRARVDQADFDGLLELLEEKFPERFRYAISEASIPAWECLVGLRELERPFNEAMIGMDLKQLDLAYHAHPAYSGVSCTLQALYETAIEAMAQGDFLKAKRMLHGIAKVCPEGKVLPLHWAALHDPSHNYQANDTRLHPIVEKNGFPAGPAALHGLAHIAFRELRIRQAVHYLQRTIDLFPRAKIHSVSANKDFYLGLAGAEAISELAWLYSGGGRDFTLRILNPNDEQELRHALYARLPEFENADKALELAKKLLVEYMGDGWGGYEWAELYSSRALSLANAALELKRANFGEWKANYEFFLASGAFKAEIPSIKLELAFKAVELHEYRQAEALCLKIADENRGRILFRDGGMELVDETYELQALEGLLIFADKLNYSGDSIEKLKNRVLAAMAAVEAGIQRGPGAESMLTTFHARDEERRERLKKRFEGLGNPRKTGKILK